MNYCRMCIVIYHQEIYIALFVHGGKKVIITLKSGVGFLVNCLIHGSKGNM